MIGNCVLVDWVPLVSLPSTPRIRGEHVPPTQVDPRETASVLPVSLALLIGRFFKYRDGVIQAVDTPYDHGKG